MNTRSPARENYRPVLIIDVDGPAAQLLALQLRHCGFETDITTPGMEAEIALRVRHYGSMIVAVDWRPRLDLEELSRLRRKAPRTWIIAISASAHRPDEKASLREVIDAFLVSPFSVEELARRLLAFSYRSRPL